MVIMAFYKIYKLFILLQTRTDYCF